MLTKKFVGYVLLLLAAPVWAVFPQSPMYSPVEIWLAGNIGAIPTVLLMGIVALGLLFGGVYLTSHGGQLKTVQKVVLGFLAVASVVATGYGLWITYPSSDARLAMAISVGVASFIGAALLVRRIAASEEERLFDDTSEYDVDDWDKGPRS